MPDGHKAVLSNKTGQKKSSSTCPLPGDLVAKKMSMGPNWLRLDHSHSKDYPLFAASRVSTGKATYDSHFRFVHENPVRYQGV